MAAGKSAFNQVLDHHMETLEASDREAINQLLAVRKASPYHDLFAMCLTAFSMSIPPYGVELPGRRRKSVLKKSPKKSAQK